MSASDYHGQPEFAGHLKVMEVLRRRDPIGVICDANQDEYDSYSVGFLSMLDRGATAEEIVAAMRDLATGHLGLPSIDEPHAQSCAGELVEFWRSWKDG